MTWHFSSGTKVSRSHTMRLFLVGVRKDAVYVPPLPTNLHDLRNSITAAVNSVTQDINQNWDEFNYRLDIVRVVGGGGGILNICKLPCIYNQM